MNFIGKLQEFTSQIMDDTLIAGSQREQKMIQVFDLCRFIEAYNNPIKIIDYTYKINVVEEEGIRKGIYFCDLVYNTKYVFDKWPYKPNNLKRMRSNLKVKELWFVSVVEKLAADNLSDSREFVEKHHVGNIYDKIFHFNFSQSSIKILK